MIENPPSVDVLSARLRQISDRLNASRAVSEPQPSSQVPVLGPLINLVRRLANRLATRWYVAPQIEQQESFAQEVTAAFDELAAILVLQEQRLAECSRRSARLEEQLAALWETAGSATLQPAGPQSDFADLFSLPAEALRAWENADLPPPREVSRPEQDLAKWYDQEQALSFPLLWVDQLTGWHYLFNMAVAGMALDCRPGDLVLDLAGASGWVSEFLSRFLVRTVLLDCVEDLLHTSRVRFGMDQRLQKGAVNHPVVGDALRLPFADATFDGVVCMNALHHMPSYETTLRELFRVLKPGKRAVFGEPGEGHAQKATSRSAMREYGAVEKNLPLPLIHVYAKRVGFARMWRYPYLYPEAMEYLYPEEAASASTIFHKMGQALPDWLRVLSLFALEKEGERLPNSDLSPLQQAQHRLQAEITLLEHHEQVAAGSRFVERVRVRNTGDVVWLAGERPHGGYVRLGVKLCDEGGRLIRDDLERPALPRDIAPGEEAELAVAVLAPSAAGRYLLRYDLVDEKRAWFELLGSKAVEHPLQVLPAEHAV